MTTTHVGGAPPFGSLLRQWRKSRGLSQLALSTSASTTPRHVSFLETGRSRPTGPMVIRLCEALAVPLRERNRMLIAAGLAATYAEEAYDQPRYERARAAVQQLLSAHEPYPAILVHKDGTVISANGGAVRLFGTDLTGENLMDWIFSRGDPSETIANWPQVAHATLSRMRVDAALDPLNEQIQAALLATEHAVQGLDRTESAGDELVVCPWFIADGEVVRTMAIAARFDNAVDVTLDELRIELIYPLDDAAEDFFRSGA